MFLAIFQIIPIFQKTNHLFSFVALPINQRLSPVMNNLSQSFSLLFKLPALKKENEELRQDINLLNAQIADLQMLSTENETLRKQIGFFSEKKYPYLISDVVGKINEDGQMFLLINKGADDGVKVGLPVVIDNGIFIGKIWKTEEKKSFVLLSFANRSHTAATLSDHLETDGVVNGERNISLKMELIPKNIEVKQGDLVTTSGLENSVPRGLIIGAVDQITASGNDLFQSCYLKVPYTVFTIEIVSVLLPYEQ